MSIGRFYVLHPQGAQVVVCFLNYVVPSQFLSNSPFDWYLLLPTSAIISLWMWYEVLIGFLVSLNTSQIWAVEKESCYAVDFDSKLKLVILIKQTNCLKITAFTRIIIVTIWYNHVWTFLGICETDKEKTNSLPTSLCAQDIAYLWHCIVILHYKALSGLVWKCVCACVCSPLT